MFMGFIVKKRHFSQLCFLFLFMWLKLQHAVTIWKTIGKNSDSSGLLKKSPHKPISFLLLDKKVK